MAGFSSLLAFWIGGAGAGAAPPPEPPATAGFRSLMAPWAGGAGGGSAVDNYTSSAVFYIPLRMVSGLWSTSGVAPGTPPGSEAWLPSIRQPIGYTDPRDGKFYCDPIWYRAFEYLFETRLGGRGAPSVPDVVSTVTATQATAAAASATVTEIAQQTQANAEALFVVREVVQGGGLDGAEQIPGVDLR